MSTTHNFAKKRVCRLVHAPAIGNTYSGVSPVVDNVMDAGRGMQQQKLTPLIPRYCQRVGLINPVAAIITIT